MEVAFSRLILLLSLITLYPSCCEYFAFYLASFDHFFNPHDFLKSSSSPWGVTGRKTREPG